MPAYTRPGTTVCLITGVWLKADGLPVEGKQIMIQPDNAALSDDGVVYTKDQLYVTPDATTGVWSVSLPPSSILGDYSVSFDGLRFRMTVPDGTAEAAFDTLGRLEV